MLRIIRRTIKISNEEIFNGLKYKILINALFFILIVVLQLEDITLKVSSNYLVTTWISINVYFVFSIFKKKNRQFILDISSLSNKKKFLLLYLVVGIMNFTWFICIFLQLIYFMSANLINALFVAMLQYIFAISLGAIGGVFYKKHVGLIIIIGLVIFNFMGYNPLIYDGASHLLSISEQLNSINVLNITNILSLLVLTFLFLFTTYLFTKLNKKHMLKKLVVITIACSISYVAILYYDYSQYNNVKKQSFMLATYGDNAIEYRAVSKNKVDEICNIIDELEKQFKKIQPNTEYSNYIIDKECLSKVLWRLQEKKPKTVMIDKNTIEVNLLSSSMIYFDEPDFLRNFIEEIQVEMAKNVNGYSQSRYTRHLIEGYSIIILKDLCDAIHIEQSQNVKTYYIDEINEIFSVPTTRFNFVYRIALLVYEKYPDHIERLYRVTLEQNPKTNKEFVQLLEVYFNEIFNDSEVYKILESI
ncbi:hypothetical protein [Abyssisolibacter fermentans]|uniref:hypothetical protein n=1 Tax=Abyssisolibacter fermentans TaxID=1766203 RepID=UPI00082A0F5C|nr:hypothetical protein [Abyssisolibacter fermentans]